MGYNNQNEYQQAGYKGLERFDITIRVIECIDLMGDLFTSLRFRGITPESIQIYESFINAFFKVFQISASMLSEKDIDLITDIEYEFSKDISLSAETSGKFLKLFEDYLFAMKKAGVYDPAVVRQYQNPYASWEKSV